MAVESIKLMVLFEIYSVLSFIKLKNVQIGEDTFSSLTLQIYKPFHPFPLPSWLATHTKD